MGDETHVTRHELATELKSFRNEMRLLLVGAMVVLKFDVPEPVTVAGLTVAAVVAVGKAVAFRFSSN